MPIASVGPSVQTRIAAQVGARRDDLVRMAQRLVAAASPNPPGDVSAAAAVAHAFLAAIEAIEIQRFETAPGVVNLVAVIRSGRPGRRLIFNGHLDTFPIGEDLGWTVPPLGGVVADGRLYGRGVSDMKGGIAASLLAASVLAGGTSTLANAALVLCNGFGAFADCMLGKFARKGETLRQS